MMKNRATCGFLVAIALLVMVLGVAGVALFSNGPLGEKMSLIINQDATAAPTVVAPRVVVVTATAAPLQKLPAVEVAPAASPTATAAPAAAAAMEKEPGTCGNRGALTLLFVGADFNGGNPPPGADAVRVVKVDYEHQAITVVAFPRDLWVRTAGLESQAISATELGLAYDYMKTATMGSEKHRITTATTIIGQSLYDNFGVTPQNYLTLQMENIPAMVDAIGGVDINIPEAFTSENGVYFSAGQQQLNGAMATEFVRANQPGGDAARRQRQQLFTKSLENTLLNAGLIAKIPELYKTFDKSITTDLSPKMIADLGCMAEAVPQQQVLFYEVSGDELVDEQPQSGLDVILYPHEDAVRAKIAEWLGD